MALTIRRTREVEPVEFLEKDAGSFDEAELVAVAKYLVQCIQQGIVERDACARELSAWVDGNGAALELAADSIGADDAPACTLLRNAAVVTVSC